MRKVARFEAVDVRVINIDDWSSTVEAAKETVEQKCNAFAEKNRLIPEQTSINVAFMSEQRGKVLRRHKITTLSVVFLEMLHPATEGEEKSNIVQLPAVPVPEPPPAPVDVNAGGPAQYQPQFNDGVGQVTQGSKPGMFSIPIQLPPNLNQMLIPNPALQPVRVPTPTPAAAPAAQGEGPVV